MGALGLEGRGRRPQGKGCLLLAVAGATSLVTLLLAVPITVLAVLALVPQEQGRGLVTGTTDPGARAQAQQRLGSQELPEEEAETDFSSRLPAAHLIGAWTKGQGLGWEAKKEEAFLRSGTQFSGAEGLALPQDGLYYLYCHVGYRGRAPPAGGGLPDRSVTLRSRLYRAGGAYGPGTPELLLEGAETVTPVLDPARTREYGPLWYTSVGFGGLVQLRRGERVYVNISHPDMVDYRRGKTFFGAVMVG
ncbi:lymphotoxin-beta [Callorhinus ursinus]|uniref:Lymphotoxin-beta n=2 Tax=Otariidae TaxID=9702 RepID=A0A3Q7NDT7_CALUR|nr:lymphotoxin-beta [Callorhinus ursinus]XP_025718349.1 lymphotoxin-beta [Callorhinus ursinus]XP_027459669.1 lymphotoxin-beta isoform X1 [Zalophus californianus]XP_027976261.1 lymphotoxin-beta [Eumetopias jubatus]